MYQLAYVLMILSFLACLFTVLKNICTVNKWTNFTRLQHETLSHNSFWLVTVSLTICSLILTYAFAICDFRLEYVAAYSSNALPFAYRVTAFWAGKQGSLLFWTWTVAIGGAIFISTQKYKSLNSDTRNWFWIFFSSVLAFLLHILITSSNPFEILPPNFVPQDGNGLNPLLQNPGMIIHPPLLLLGYGGFTVPACLALAQALSGSVASKFTLGENHWAEICRPFIFAAWMLLTAGIIIGAWWAYMELGWGGYWAWDPVENASLLPWLISTAYIHTAIIEHHRKKLVRTNIFLMVLITISAFFASYLVRSGVVASLHAFGSGDVTLPFISFVFFSLFITGFICFSLKVNSEPLEDIFSREGLLLIVAWLLIALSIIILIATMWPVIMQGILSIMKYLPVSMHSAFSNIPTGLKEAFYNRVCLPLFTLFSLLLLVCPHIKWNGGFNRKTPVTLAFASFICFFCLMWVAGIHIPLAAIASASAIAAILGIAMLFAANPKLFTSSTAVAAHGVHIGLLLIILGVSFSGPYSRKTENVAVIEGQSVRVDSYNLKLEGIWLGESAPDARGNSNYEFYEAELSVTKDDGKFVGVITPQLRSYQQPKMLMPEIDTIPSLGDELYISLISVDGKNKKIELTVYINPLVNWLWIGGTLMSLFPLWSMRRKRTNSFI